MIITIDGPIATGKSTIAKKLAERIGYIYFDTGAMYRCVTYALIARNIDFNDPKELAKFLKTFKFEISIFHGEKRYSVEGEDVSQKIRGEAVTSLVSEVSANKEVREKLVALQRDWAMGVNAVFEGRDIGTVVFPKAELKIFLTGRMDVRAKRRYDELRAKFPKETENLTLEQTSEEIMRRDTYDSTREISPLRQADDAYVVDTSDLTPEEIVDQIIEYRDSLTA
jgi:CMP/dCMP kinase